MVFYPISISQIRDREHWYGRNFQFLGEIKIREEIPAEKRSYVNGEGGNNMFRKKGMAFLILVSLFLCLTMNISFAAEGVAKAELDQELLCRKGTLQGEN